MVNEEWLWMNGEPRMVVWLWMVNGEWLFVNEW